MDGAVTIAAPFIRNCWYVAMWAEGLQPGALVSRTILNEPIVFFRKTDGAVAAMTDRCPHRFAPLHLGKILPEDRVQCPYHGLEFDPSGACVRNPHGNGAIPSLARVTSYPVIEKHSLIWLWMGSGTPDPAMVPDYSMFDGADPLFVTYRDCIKMQAGYALITDNLLDLSHTSYLHDGILGNEAMVDAEMQVEQTEDTITVSRASTNAPIPGLFRMLVPTEMPVVDKWNTIRWNAPGCLLVNTGVHAPGSAPESGTGFWGVHILTPETERSTYYHFAAVRWSVLTEGQEFNEKIREDLARIRRFAFAEQDAPVIEEQQKAIDLSGGSLRPVMLSIDAGPVRYRRVLDSMIKAEATTSSTSRE